MRVNFLDIPQELRDELWHLRDQDWLSDVGAGTYYLRSDSEQLFEEPPAGPYQELYFPHLSRWIVVPDPAWQKFLDEHFHGVCPAEVQSVPGNGPLLNSVLLILTENFPSL